MQRAILRLEEFAPRPYDTMSIFITRYTTDVVFSVGIISREALPSDEHRRRQIPLPEEIYHPSVHKSSSVSLRSRVGRCVQVQHEPCAND